MLLGLTGNIPVGVIFELDYTTGFPQANGRRHMSLEGVGMDYYREG